jgi:hypothetical protein
LREDEQEAGEEEGIKEGGKADGRDGVLVLVLEILSLSPDSLRLSPPTTRTRTIKRRSALA